MQEKAPWFVWLILEAVGVMLIASGIPLALRRVPPNIVYGVRFHSTLRNDTVWYEINARGGRHFIVIGLAYLIALNAMLLAKVDDITIIAVALALLTGPTLIDAVILHRAASRLAQALNPQGSGLARSARRPHL